MRIFHIYADGKTIKEISWETYRKLSWKECKRKKFLRIWDNEMMICHYNSYIHIRREQLEQVLKECWNE